MHLDPRQLPDWRIAEAAEEGMKSPKQLADELGIREDELLPEGRNLARVEYRKVLERAPKDRQAKYVDVTAITPTPLGEGKTTTTIGLVQGLGRLGHQATAAIRQPSAGPTFNIKGSAAGGGLSQCIPLAPFSLGLTGDINALVNAHNLGMVALTARMQHERNYDDETLARRNLKRLDIDPDNVHFRWIIDFCAQALRHIVIGRGGKMDGLEMESGFDIAVSSELMAILAVCRDLADLRERIGRIIVATSRGGDPVTTADLEVDGAMTAWMVQTLNPTLMQTLEGQPVFVHAGPFANIAIGQSSVIADRLACRLSEYHVTESGFGADIGFEKFWNLKCRYSRLHPDAVVVVATVRALKMHGGGPAVKPGVDLDYTYTHENLELLEKGCANLRAHIRTVRQSGVRPVVCINAFHTDTKAEHDRIRRIADEEGALCAVSEHWLHGGDGARELAEMVVTACEAGHEFTYLYPDGLTLRERIHTIATRVYGADGVDYGKAAAAKLDRMEADPAQAKLDVCMLKTHLSLSDDPDRKGAPTGWTLPVRDVLHYAGAGLAVPVAGTIKLMPGTGSNPGFRRIDVDTGTGHVTGLF